AHRGGVPAGQPRGLLGPHRARGGRGRDRPRRTCLRLRWRGRHHRLDGRHGDPQRDSRPASAELPRGRHRQALEWKLPAGLGRGPGTRRERKGMKRASLLLVLALAAPATPVAQETAGGPPETRDHGWLDHQIGHVVEHYGLPGIAVGIIEGGEVTHVHTSGERVAGSGEPVTSSTLFKIASNTKAMTASVLARLVDAGKLAWDDPV